MTEKWTSGPWDWDAGDAGQDYSAPYCDVFANDGDLIIASVNARFDRTQGRANARLIAAAPDMVEALILWAAAEKEEVEGARQVGRQMAREKRDAALARARREVE